MAILTKNLDFLRILFFLPVLKIFEPNKPVKHLFLNEVGDCAANIHKLNIDFGEQKLLLLRFNKILCDILYRGQLSLISYI